MKINFNSKKLMIICAIVSFNAMAQNPFTEVYIPEKIDTIICIAKQTSISENWDFSAINFTNYQNTSDSDLVQLKDPHSIYSNANFTVIGDTMLGSLPTKQLADGLITMTQKGNFEAKYEGFGTLKLPGNTIINCEKIKVKELYYLLLKNDTIVKYINTYFAFFKKTDKDPLLTVFNKKRIFKGNMLVEYNGIAYCNLIGSSVNESNPLLLSIVPNPANTNTQLNYTLPTNSSVSIEISNQASTINTVIYTGNKAMGQHQTNIPLNGYPTGIYTVKITANGMLYGATLIVN